MEIIKTTYNINDMAQNMSVSFIEQDEASVKKAFDVLLVWHEWDKDLVLADMGLNPIAVANADLWSSQLSSTVKVFNSWSADSVEYAIDDIINYLGITYKVIQAHTSQATWTPVDATSLFQLYRPITTVYEWVQPTGAHDAWAIGALVFFEGATYKSLIDANTYSPTAYPAGWEVQV